MRKLLCAVTKASWQIRSIQIITGSPSASLKCPKDQALHRKFQKHNPNSADKVMVCFNPSKMINEDLKAGVFQ
jgi:aspartate carbamoyltransferase regulatory subunit